MKETHRVTLILALTLLVVGLDLSLPLGVATGVLYSCILFLTATSTYRQLPVLAASAASFLVVLGIFGPVMEGVPLWMGLTNRALSIVVIWIAVSFLLQRRRAEEALQQARDGLELRVRERTFELAQVNKALVVEITERIETEESLRASQAAFAATQRALQQSQEDLRALTARLLTAQEEERRRISRDLHDDINQRLAMFVVELAALERAHPEAPVDLGSRLRSLQDNAAELTEDVRHLAYQFHPSVLDDFGLLVALERLVEDFAARSNIPCVFRQDGVTDPVSSPVATCLYRITQESLNNVAKHADATQVDVELKRDNGMLSLSITDNGVGFHPIPRARVRASLGMASMRERARLVKGELDIQSHPGRGTTVCARIPVPR